MKLINQLIEELMPKKRGETKFMTTNSINHWNKLELTDDVR